MVKGTASTPSYKSDSPLMMVLSGLGEPIMLGAASEAIGSVGEMSAPNEKAGVSAISIPDGGRASWSAPEPAPGS
jgi:hypothetical protein